MNYTKGVINKEDKIMCNNLDYIKQQISSNELIYIDTCSLLDVVRLNNFIDSARQIFIENDKKIIVHYSVLEELYKFRFSSNEKKRKNASDALDIIFNNSDLFVVESNPDTDKEAECFADMKLLSTLFERRRKHKQLLISNDHALTSDAFNFNNLASVSGNRINVCYLNHFGNMNICACVKESKSGNNSIQKDIEIKNTSAIEQEPKVIIQKEFVEKKTPVLKKYGVPMIAFIFGSLFGGLGTAYLKNKA